MRGSLTPLVKCEIALLRGGRRFLGAMPFSRKSVLWRLRIASLLAIAAATLIAAPAPAFYGRVGPSFGPDGPGPVVFGDPLPTDPVGLAVDPAGNALVVQGSTVRRFSPAGELVGVWPAELGRPNGLIVGVAVDPAGSVFLSDPARGRVLKYAPDGTLLDAWTGLGDGPGGAPGDGLCPEGVATDATGNVYTTCGRNGTFEKTSPAGDIVMRGASCLSGPIAVGPDGRIYVTSCSSIKTVIVYGPDGAGVGTVGKLRPAGGDPSQPAEEGFFGPWQNPQSSGGDFGGASGLTVDPNGILWVADPDNARFQGFRDGRFVAACAPKEHNRIDVLAASASGEIVASDHSRVQRFADTANASQRCDSRWRELRFGAAQLRLSRRNTVSVRMRCLGVPGTCRGTVRLSLPRSLSILGRRAYEISANHPRTLKIRISKRNAAQLRRVRRVKVLVSAAGATVDGSRYAGRAVRRLVVPAR